MLYQPLEQLSYTAWALEGAAAGMQRVFEILDAEDSVPESPGAKPMPRARGEIAFENVAFAYDAEHPILRGITLEREAGPDRRAGRRNGRGQDDAAFARAALLRSRMRAAS